jgi:hypothetical protein
LCFNFTGRRETIKWDMFFEVFGQRGIKGIKENKNPV